METPDIIVRVLSRSVPQSKFQGPRYFLYSQKVSRFIFHKIHQEKHISPINFNSNRWLTFIRFIYDFWKKSFCFFCSLIIVIVIITIAPPSILKAYVLWFYLYGTMELQCTISNTTRRQTLRITVHIRIRYYKYIRIIKGYLELRKMICH